MYIAHCCCSIIVILIFNCCRLVASECSLFAGPNNANANWQLQCKTVNLNCLLDRAKERQREIERKRERVRVRACTLIYSNTNAYVSFVWQLKTQYRGYHLKSSSSIRRVFWAENMNSDELEMIKKTWEIPVATPTDSGAAILTAFFNRFPSSLDKFPFNNVPLEELPVSNM